MENNQDNDQSISDRIERFEEKHFFTFYGLLASPFVSWFLYHTYLAQADKEHSAFSLVFGPIMLIVVLFYVSVLSILVLRMFVGLLVSILIEGVKEGNIVLIAGALYFLLGIGMWALDGNTVLSMLL